MDKKILLGLVSRRPWKYTDHKQKKTFIQNVIRQHTARLQSTREVGNSMKPKQEVVIDKFEIDRPTQAVIKNNKISKRSRPKKQVVKEEREREEQKVQTRPPYFDPSDSSLSNPNGLPPIFKPILEKFEIKDTSKIKEIKDSYQGGQYTVKT